MSQDGPRLGLWSTFNADCVEPQHLKNQEMWGRFEQPLQCIQSKAFEDATNKLEDLVLKGRHQRRDIAMNKVSNVHK